MNGPLPLGIPAAVYFSAGKIMTSGGPRPTPCDADYDSASMRYVRPRPYNFQPTPTLMMPGPTNPNARGFGLRACYQVFNVAPMQTSDYGKSGPWYGNQQQNPMNLYTPLKIQPMLKMRG